MRSLILAVALTLGAAAAGAQGLHFGRTTSLSPFWRELQDNTLSQLVQEALQANADVHIAAARLTSTRASRRLAALDLLPSVTATGSAARQQLKPEFARIAWAMKDLDRTVRSRRSSSTVSRYPNCL